jgi:hypothetical protein
MSDVSARLVVQQGPYPEQEYLLSKTSTSVGRSPDNDLVFPDPELSRQHAQIIMVGNTYTLKDLGSTNGSFVNGRRVTGSTELKDGDIVGFGEAVSLLFQLTASQPTIASPPYSLAEEETMFETPDMFLSAEEEEKDVDYVTPVTPPPFPAYEYEPAGRYTAEPSFHAPRTAADTTRRNVLVGCGCLLLSLLLCGAALFWLDGYEGGRLLYCGPARPLFELLLGPLGFSPACDFISFTRLTPVL